MSLIGNARPAPLSRLKSAVSVVASSGRESIGTYRADRGKRGRSLLLALLAFSPTIWAIIYYGVFATPRYVSESSFVVRSATRTSVASGLSAILKMVGISSSQDNTFAVHDFMTSRDAIDQLSTSIDLRAIYGTSEADRLARFPNIFFGQTSDEFHRYLQRRMVISFNPNTGISTLQVQAFRPEDAQRISNRLMELGEQVINRMNTRIHDDSVRFAQSEVTASQNRLRQAQVALTNFRNQEIQIDPSRNSYLVLELIGKLSDEYGRVRAQITEMGASSPDSPQRAPLERRAEALAQQIAIERARVTDGSDGLAKKIARFEELNLEREFAARTLASAILALDSARGEARRQQLYLERIAGPSLPDKAMMPERFYEVISLFAINLIVVLIGWLIRTGVTEHAPRVDQGGQ